MSSHSAGSVSAAPDAVDVRLAEVAAGLPPIVCFANDWRGDPTSKHHIMRHFGRHLPVLWVESSGMRRPRLGDPADLRRILRKLSGNRGAAAPSPAAEPVRVISPVGLPLPGSRVAEAVNAWVYRRAVRRAQAAGALPLLWVYTPTVEPYLDGIPHAGVVYHCVDRWWAFSEYDTVVMQRHHTALCRRADVVFASSAELLDDCRAHAPGAVLMPHGVDWDHFSRAAFESLPRPADVAGLTGPVIGFFGLLHDWIDQDLLVATARACADATLLLIGKAPVDIGRLVAEPNVRWLGQKAFAELPAYAAAFDVALVPFVRNELTAAVNPIKLLEYLSAGVPVVATALPEVVRMNGRPGLTVCDDAASFVASVRRITTPESAEARRDRSLAQRPDSWAGRCVAMAEAIGRILPEAASTPGTAR